jgi:HK97 family phage prohead protease
MRTKQARTLRLKAVSGADGTFEALVSIFNNVDWANDRVVPGAFTNSLARWAASGDPIPVIYNHDWADPFANIGKVLDAAERPVGLWVKGQIDLDTAMGAQVFRLLEQRRVREASFAYDVIKERRAADGANELVELDLIEVGPTLKGMNDMTQLLGVKSAALTPRMVRRATNAMEVETRRMRRRPTPPHLLTPATVAGAIRDLEA